MRLLHAATLKFRDFPDAAIPPYAILSHTWEDKQEVTLQDMASPYLTDKKGYDKIATTCRLALQRGLQYAWIDTCCIDKTNNTELTESINSMFRWYQNATVCFVHLKDLDVAAITRDPTRDGGGGQSTANNNNNNNNNKNTPAAAADPSDDAEVDGRDDRFVACLRQCLWFKRGWTLQELLAPRHVEFYDTAWEPIGSKIKLAGLVAEITRIPVPAVVGEERLSRYSTAQRMAWASQRSTTKTEDAAYCLLGLFDVNMPLIYGEGHRAFQRLQEEIIKRTTDLTLFAWMPAPSSSPSPPLRSPSPPPRSSTQHHRPVPLRQNTVVPPPPPSPLYMPLLAASPAEFGDCHHLSQFRNDDSEFAVTNRGLRITTYLVLVPMTLSIDERASASDMPPDMIGDIGSTLGGGTGTGTGSTSISTNTNAVNSTLAGIHPRYRYMLSIGCQGRRKSFDAGAGSLADAARSPFAEVGIWLKKVGPGLFLREASPTLALLSRSKLKYTNTTENHTFYILLHPHAADAQAVVAAGGGMMSPTNTSVAVMQPMQPLQPPPPPHPATVGPLPGTTAATTATTSHHLGGLSGSDRRGNVYHPRLIPRGVHVPVFNDRGIYFSTFPANAWDERTRVFCQPESRGDVVAFPCSSRQGPDGRDNLEFGVLIDYRQKRDEPRCLVVDRRTLDGRLLFLLAMRQQGEPVRWYVVSNELPSIAESTHVLHMQSDGGRVYEVVASIVESQVRIDDYLVTMSTLDLKITNVSVGLKVPVER
ncbi:Heterokaryon incompatibility [Niveomyces insectorum RCEF 264]|uniref:Heterokaryon incompatibility n=1 Tax=Niveomyces insectorum RCEF 264 TaxID=1081102 RepID=A0A167Y6A0_9HYPO|nr:Heterokaryon incompatibility [Niveomyces insectorum RCEF 264]